MASVGIFKTLESNLRDLTAKKKSYELFLLKNDHDIKTGSHVWLYSIATTAPGKLFIVDSIMPFNKALSTKFSNNESNVLLMYCKLFFTEGKMDIVKDKRSYIYKVKEGYSYYLIKLS